MSDIWLILAGIVILAGLIIVNVLLLRIRKRRKIEFEAERQQEKERMLDRMLENPMEQKKEAESLYLRPYEEKYTEMQTKNPPAKRGVQTEIIVRSSHVQRKYHTMIFRPMNIGTRPDNDLVIDSRIVPGHSCVLYPDRNTLWLKRSGRRGEIVLVRRRKRIPVGDNPVQIRSKDRIVLEDAEMEIYLR